MKLPLELPVLDPIALARSAADGSGSIFQRFDLATRQLTSSIVPLVVERVDAGSFAAGVRAGMRSGAPLFVHAGNAALLAGESASDSFPSHCIFQLVQYVEIDHRAGEAWLVDTRQEASPGVLEQARGRLPATTGVSRRGAPREPAPEWQHDATFDQYSKQVASIQEALHRGMAEGAVLSLGLSRPTTADPLEIYRECVAANPSPYGFVLRDGPYSLIGSSPLAFLELDGLRRIRLETDAGTRPATGNPAADAAAEADLLRSPKDLAEHRVVVDAELEALHPIAAGGRIATPVSKQVRRFSHVMHLYTVFEAELADGMDVVDAIAGLYPPAAVSGHPKRAALALGRDTERGSRGPYGGIVGLIRPDGSAELAVVIRSLWVHSGIARIRVGGKIVPTSEPEAEYREALSKAQFLVDAVARAEARVAAILGST